MLCLKSSTNPEWIAVAVANPDEIINDHAHCEKKAAAFAMALIQRYPDRSRLVNDMIDIAKEELDHFEQVHQFILKRGKVLTYDRGNSYAQQLHEHIRKSEPERLLDSLMVGAFIEARSCERFSLLCEHVPDKELAEFYRSLLASEAGHYRAYTDIAREYYPTALVKQRLNEFGDIEAQIIRSMKNNATMHG